MEEEKKNEKSVFATLNAIDVNEHKEEKPTGNGRTLSYLSWPWAYAEVKKRYPDASYTIYRDEQNRPYIEDPDFGLMCMTTVTIQGMTHEMWLPVMDSSNRAMRRQPYQYQVWDSKKNQYVNKTVQAANMFDINKTIMRCLVKNLAMFGLGLYIYAGEDLPESEEENPENGTKKTKSAVVKEKPAVPSGQPVQRPTEIAQLGYTIEVARQEIAKAFTKEQLTAIYNGNKHLQGNEDFLNALTERKNQILNGNGKTAA